MASSISTTTTASESATQATSVSPGRTTTKITTVTTVEPTTEALTSTSEDGIEATVVDMHTIKPLDEELVSELAKTCGAIVSAEDHSIIGGLGGAIAEYLSSTTPVPLERIGVSDRFGESGGSDELLAMLGMKDIDIVRAAHDAISRK